MRVVLASASPRRRELLAAAAIAVDVDPVDVDERREPDEPPERYVERVARLKAAAGLRRHPDAIVIGADTAVVLDSATVLGKPCNLIDARRMIEQLAGRAHDVLTGVAVGAGSRVDACVERTTVWFQAMTQDEIAWYVDSDEPLDKAGGYAIQGRASRFIPRIDGSYSTVVGLPVWRVVAMLQRFGWRA